MKLGVIFIHPQSNLKVKHIVFWIHRTWLIFSPSILEWRHIERDGVSNQMRVDHLLIQLFRHRSQKTKLRVTGLCEVIPPVTGGFPSQEANNAENVSIW